MIPKSIRIRAHKHLPYVEEQPNGNNLVHYIIRKHKHNISDKEVCYNKKTGKWFCDCKYMVFVMGKEKICSHIAAVRMKEGMI